MTRRPGENRWILLAICAASTVMLAAAGSAQEYLMGPSGGAGGTIFADDVPIVAASRVSEIRVWTGQKIDAIQMVHRTETGPHALGKHGGTGGSVVTFQLEPDEVITAMSGRYSTLIDQIQFHTSKGRSSPVFGTNESSGQFRYEAPPGTEIAGFTGRAGKLLDGLGVILRPTGSAGE